jgi:hypothetical protein
MGSHNSTTALGRKIYFGYSQGMQFLLVEISLGISNILIGSSGYEGISLQNRLSTPSQPTYFSQNVECSNRLLINLNSICSLSDQTVNGDHGHVLIDAIHDF